ncbi:MAG TPA: hypothetical protein VKB93_24100 [Thermoanaerobaculia bacterium]|nr:hypothetical protein [Thermoanaerobaculia bacterium]
MFARLLFVAGHAAALIVLASTCHATGMLAVRRASFRSALEQFCVASTIGFGIAGTVLFLIGLAHALYAPVVVAYVVIVHVCAFPRLRLRVTVYGVLLAAVLAFFFLYTLYPPSEWDATMYHLPFAKAFATQHAVVFVDTLRFPVFPQLNELLFSGMLLLCDDVSTHAVAFLALALTALLLYAWGGGLLSAAFFLGHPMAISLGSSAYVDAGLTLFVVAAVLFWQTWRETEALQWLILSAASAGFAAGTKYHGLVIVAALAVATLIVAVKRKNLRAAAIFLLIAALSGGAFYVRTWAWTGNPVFPFFTRVFGDNEWHATQFETKIDENGGNVVRALLPDLPNLRRLTYDPNGVPYSMSIYLLLPLFAWVWWRAPRLRVISAIAAGYLLLFAQFDPRFLLPAFAILSLIGGIGLGFLPRRFTLPIALLLLLPALYWTARQLFHHRVLFPVTAEARRDYLSRRLPGYSQLELLNRLHGDRYTVYAIAMDPVRFYADGRMVGDRIGPYRYELHTTARSMRALGAEYLLVNAEWPLPVVSKDPRATLYRLPN